MANAYRSYGPGHKHVSSNKKGAGPVSGTPIAVESPKTIRAKPVTDPSSLKVSFVIPTYNRSEMLERVLFSLHRQRDPNYEALVSVDDDAEHYPQSQSVVDKYLELGMPLKVFYTGQYKRGRGWSVETYPYNVGIRAATGTVTVLNSGDVLSVSNTIAQYRSTVHGNTCVVSTTHAVTLDVQQAIESHGWRQDPKKLLFKGSCYKMFSGCGPSYTQAYAMEEAHTPYHFQMGVLSSHLKEMRGFDEDFYGRMPCADDDIATRLKRKGIQFLWCPDILAVHQFHKCPEQISEYGAPYNTQWASGYALCQARAGGDIIRNDENWGSYPRVGFESQVPKVKRSNMIPIITGDSAAVFDALEKHVIEINRFDTVSEWHWSPAYDYVSKTSGPYTSLWRATREDRAQASVFCTATPEACVTILKTEIEKVKVKG